MKHLQLPIWVLFFDFLENIYFQFGSFSVFFYVFDDF